MRRARREVFAIAAVAALVLLAGNAAAQDADAPPTTLIHEATLNLLSDGTLSANGTGETPATRCVGLGAGPGAPPPSATFDVLLTNGSYYLYPAPAVTALVLGLHLGNNAGDTGNPTAVGGYSISATLQIGNDTTIQSDVISRGLAMNQPVPQESLSFPVNGSQATATRGPVSITVSIEGAATGGMANDVAVWCNDQATKLSAFRYALGRPGDGDIDGDGMPDSEDTDRDGDGVLNVQEQGIPCQVDGTNTTFADSPELQPGESDPDADGYTSQEECEAGANPLSQFSTPPQPPQFPWALIILIVVILALIGGILYLFLTFGRTVVLTLASARELIIEPGATGKYELAAQNLRKKGDPVTYEIVVENVPEGWDAKASVEHVSLGPRGAKDNEKSITLRVEAPDHKEPESAVVTVKAVPLNKAGRKDTLKLAGKVKSITSINVPPDAIVPVKKGGPVKTKAPEAGGAPEAKAPAGGWTVGDLPGVGGAKAKKLEAAGVRTTDELAAADLGKLSKKTKLGEADLAKLRDLGLLLKIPGVAPEHLEGLKEAGIESPGALAALDPDDLVARFNAKATPQAEGE